MKKAFFILVLVAWMLPISSHAQIDQRCWIEEDCYRARQTYLNLSEQEARNPKAFRQDDTTRQLCKGDIDASGKKIGFCLPATTAKTKIAIGGQTEFTGLTEFVAFIYKYGMGVASVLSVLVLIFAGVQWIISGGNAEAISSAKHKIVGAVIGLVILAAAYTILYTVNPDLVNLRPPNAWMINTQKISNPYCSNLNPGNKISKNPSNETGQKISDEQKKAGFSALSTNDWVTVTSTENNTTPIAPPAHCGQDYYVQNTGALTCQGSACPAGNVCYDKNKSGKPGCFRANIAGKISSGNLLDNALASTIGILRQVVNTTLNEGWDGPTWANEPEIYSVCNDGNYDNLSTEGNDPDDAVSDLTQSYYITTSDSEIEEHVQRCESNGGFKGFVLSLDMDEAGDPVDERHFIGRKGTNGIDLGDKAKVKADCVLSIIKSDYFISEAELKQGIPLDVDVAFIYDIDNNDEDQNLGRMFHYGHLKNFFIEDNTNNQAYQKCI